jgi:hypothetical protein
MPLDPETESCLLWIVDWIVFDEPVLHSWVNAIACDVPDSQATRVLRLVFLPDFSADVASVVAYLP